MLKSGKVLVVKKLLPIILVATVYLTPLYPIYAQQPQNAVNPRLKAATTPGNLKTVMVAEQAVENMLSVRDRMASRAAELSKKLAKFKDKVKAKRVENINANLNNINSRRTSQMQAVLQKIANILERIKTKTQDGASAGKDVTAINAGISNLEKEWAEADAAVKAQADKDYSIVVNTESTVKADASLARDSLRTDLQATHNQVVEAKQALAKALSTALSSLKGGNNGSQ